MTALALTDTETEVFAVGVQEAYQHSDYFDPSWGIFTGPIVGETGNVPVVQTGEATNKADGTTHTPLGHSIVGVEIPLVDPIKAYADILKTQVDVRPDLNLIANVGAQLGRDVGFGRSIRMSNYLVNQALANNNEYTDDFNTLAGLEDAVEKGIRFIASAFDDAGIPQNMRFGLLKPTPFYSISQKTTIRSSDFSQGQNQNQSMGGNMDVARYLNFDIRNMGGIFGVDWTDAAHSNKNLPSGSETNMEANLTDIVGLFWHHDSWAVRHQTGIEASIDWIQREQVWMAISRLHLGIKAIQVEGLWVLVHASA